MDKTYLGVLMTIGFSITGIVGDYFLKRASGETHPFKSVWFCIGFVIYASTAFGWVLAMKHLKLATIGVVYSISTIVLLTLVGAIAFHEKLNVYEVVGIALAIAALVLLVRFA
jgi:multidrug transporter EmrE-like cation transporter